MTDLEKMERRMSLIAVERAIEEKFSKLILKSEKKDGPYTIWLTISIDNEYTREWITKDKNELDQIFDKYLKSYLAPSELRTQEYFIQKEIEWAKVYQSYYPNYLNCINHLTHFSVLQDWIDYLENKKNEGSEVKVNLKENTIPQNEHSKYFSNSTQQSFFEYLIENYISEEITPVKFSWVFRFMNRDIQSPNILMSQIAYRKFIIY